MRSLTIYSYCEPAKYKLAALPAPDLSLPTDVLIKVHAACINPGDLNVAAGLTKLMVTAKFPYKIGHDLSGTVVRVGADIRKFVVGDDVYTSLPLTDAGRYSSPRSG